MPTLPYQIGAFAAKVPDALYGLGQAMNPTAFAPGIADFLARQAEEANRGFLGTPEMPMPTGPRDVALPPQTSLAPPPPQPPAIEQAIASRPPVQNSLTGIEANAYRGQDMPQWSGVGGGPRTASQIEQDIYARGLLNAENTQIMGGIEEALARRGDPMQRATEANAQTLQYERTLPFGSQSRVRASVGGQELGGYGDGQELGGPTAGEARSLDQRLALHMAGNPKDALAIEQAINRKREMQKLAHLAGINAQLVAVGRMPQSAADDELRRAYELAAQKGALSEGDFAALQKLLYPGPNAMGVGAMD